MIKKQEYKFKTKIMNTLTRIMTTKINTVAKNKTPLVPHSTCGVAANWLRARRKTT